MKKTTILVVDDHQVIIDGLRLLLESEKNIEVLGAKSETEARNVLKKEQPDLVLLDIELIDTNFNFSVKEEINGIDIARSIRLDYPRIKILMLTMHNDPVFINDSISENDVDGYLLKNIGYDELNQAIKTVLEGGKYYSPEVMRSMSVYMKDEIKKKREEALKPTLTPREIELLRYLADDLSAKEIADQMNISVNTVNAHKQSLIDKLDVNSSLGLVRFAVEEGYIHSSN